MKILLITGNYLPGKNGGIENYSHWLATLLLQNHLEVEVAALNVNETEDYFYEGVKVNYLKGSFSVFESLLAKGNFDICHFHEYSEYGGIEILWFIKAKEYSKKVFFTFHLPYFTCYKGDFRYKGGEDCNTFSDSKRCTECVISDRTGYQKAGRSEMYLSIVSGMMAITGKKRKLEKRIIEKYQKLNELVSICDHIFIYADWFKNILSKNGYNGPSIKKIPYKTKTNIPGADEKQDRSIKNKLLFVGRIQYQKGLHLLCQAMNDIASKDIQLDVYGNIIDQKYFEKCLKKYSFNFKGTTGYHHLLSILKEYDFLVLPSVFTEMFSLVIKDVFYEKVPVIASSAKGNKDAIVDGINGFLFKYNDAKDLTATIDKAYQLKNNGWNPLFSEPEDPEKDTEEIVSYYK
ncbi:MAG TPA: glycosyltransferase [Hanamia sp.]|nr:glycosyltransferase [Hanamia sp.]